MRNTSEEPFRSRVGNKLYSEDYYMERAMAALEPLVVNDYQMWCTQPGCGYKSRKNTDKAKVIELGMKHQVKNRHTVALLNHQIKVDIFRSRQGSLEVQSDQLSDPAPF